MSDVDIKSVESFVREFVEKYLLPTMERNVQHWNEHVASARRGLTGRLFTAGRRYFGAPARTNTGDALSSPAGNIAYLYTHFALYKN